MGTYKPIARPLWSTFVWKTELVTGLYETINAPLISLLRGTPFAAPFLRLLGCKIGKRVFIDTTFFSEFDLVDIEDEAAINLNATMQTHLFEDRVMKMSYLKIGRRCTVGSGSIVLYDTFMEENSKLGSLSLLMKGEILPSWTSWKGNPAKLDGGAVALDDAVIEENSRLSSPISLNKGETLPSWNSWGDNPVGLLTIHSMQTQPIDIDLSVEDE
jgi:carbonic anhydrase/acetyltransferase-like protein (isoleucine patch superfamily)